ncbi:MAG: adenylyltransferase/cytidyltransferase family protein [Candidatus Aminicenantes bacterium]|nr:adenylyltransferase/cytidyltransferase family protein [Candidatus Aminicenantes bacterium]
MPLALKSPKIKSLSALKKIVEEAHLQKKKVVLANGCFDLIHIGHIRYLLSAKRKGHILIVAINSDRSVRELKGFGRPLLSERERAYIIASFWFVDYVTIFDQRSVDHILKKIRPDVHAKGSDYRPETVPEKQTAKKLGLKIAIVGGPKIKSSSTVIKQLVKKLASKEARKVKK